MATGDVVTGAHCQAPLQSVTLHELNNKSCRIGTWTLRVHRPDVHTYSYEWKGQRRETSRFKCLLVSLDSDEYCCGVAKRKYERNDLDALKSNFFAGSVWHMSKIVLIDEKKEYLGCSCKVVVDMRASHCAAVLQSLQAMPPEPTPAKAIADILQLPQSQRVDFMAIIRNVSESRIATTPQGSRIIVDIAVCDGSMLNGSLAQVKIPLFFPNDAAGKEAEAKIRSLCAANSPVSLFNMACIPSTDAGAKVTLKTSWGFFFDEAMHGPKAAELKEKGPMFAHPEALVAEISSVWEPDASQARDWAAELATHTTCALLRALVGSYAGEQTTDSIDELYQLNHVYVPLPNPGQTRTANGQRVWFTTDVVDRTGSLTVSFREQAALELSE